MQTLCGVLKPVGAVPAGPDVGVAHIAARTDLGMGERWTGSDSRAQPALGSVAVATVSVVVVIAAAACVAHILERGTGVVSNGDMSATADFRAGTATYFCAEAAVASSAEAVTAGSTISALAGVIYQQKKQKERKELKALDSQIGGSMEE